MITEHNAKLSTSTTHINKGCIIFIIFASIAVGCMQVTISGINIQLSNWIGNPLRATCIQFSVATLCLLPVSVLHKSEQTTHKLDGMKNLIKKLKLNNHNYIVFANGLLGVIFVCSGIYIAPQIGFSLYAIASICGQIIASMLIDQFGLIWSAIKKLSILNMFGAFIAICGVIIFQIPIFIGDSYATNINVSLLFIYIIISILAGISFTVQAALNRRLKTMMKSTAYQSSFWSFLNGTVLLLIVNIMLYIINNDWFKVNNKYLYWYIFFGGIMGAIVVTLYIIAPEYIGFVATYICAVFGSLITSIIYDYFGTFGVKKDSEKQVFIWKVVGIICVFVGALMVNINKSHHIETKPDTVDINDEGLNSVIKTREN